MTKGPVAFIIPIMFVAVVPAVAWSEPVSFFRSEGGVYDSGSTRLPEQFDSGDTLRWRRPLDPGASTPCVHGDTIFLTTYHDEKSELAVVALDRTSGNLRWKHVVPASQIESVHPVGSPASCTPACDGERLYVFFGSYGVLSFDLDGQPLWERRMGPFQDEFGSNSSPILVDGKLILNQDHDINNFVTALDAKTGRTLWETSRDSFTRSYATPVILDRDGEKQLIVAGSLRLVAYDPADGREQWSVEGLARIVNPTPAISNGSVYVASWSPGGDTQQRIGMDPWPQAAKTWDRDGDGLLAREELPEGPVTIRFYRIDLDQNGKLDEEEWTRHAKVFQAAQNTMLAVRPGGSDEEPGPRVAWSYRRGLPYVASPLVYQGVVYLVANGGVITTLDAVKGNVLKRGRARGTGNYYASPVAADGKVYLASEQGVVTVLAADPQWTIISGHDFGERILATPVIADGKIYLRTDEALYCFATP